MTARLDRTVIYPSNVCWSCRSLNVSSTDHDGHGAGEFVNPERNGRFTTRCEDCGAVWEGQLRMVSSSPNAALDGQNSDGKGAK